jgi:uncharacterized Zn finger protein
VGGVSWWGQRLSDAVEELIDEGRLQRGRTLARTGSVLSMTVEPGRVSGQVQGSEVRPYTASFLLAPLLDTDAAAVLGLLEREPELVAAMVAGELPRELGEPEHGLFPRFADELDFECTCPDWGWPCKHAAALVHVLVEGIDAQPHTLLALRGVDVQPLLGLRSAAEPEDALSDHLADYFAPRGPLVQPRVQHRPALEDLDAELLRAALRSAGGGSGSAEDAVAWLREAYGRLR